MISSIEFAFVFFIGQDIYPVIRHMKGPDNREILREFQQTFEASLIELFPIGVSFEVLEIPLPVLVLDPDFFGFQVPYC